MHDHRKQNLLYQTSEETFLKTVLKNQHEKVEIYLKTVITKTSRLVQTN